MDLAIRTIREDEFEPYIVALESAFHGILRPDEIDNIRRVTEVDRSLAVYEGDEIVAGATANSLRMTVPGNVLSVAAVTGVGVKATHRRRGINTALMRRQLDDVRERGEPLAALFASEGGIYGRYGYGLAAFECAIDIETGRSAFVRGYSPSGRVRLLPREEALPLMLPVYDHARRARPGMMEVDLVRFEHEHFEPAHEREERPCFYALHESEGDLDAYAVYQLNREWRDGIPQWQLQVRDLHAISPQAYADMWRYLLDTDLVQRVTSSNRPADEPLLHLLREPRRLRLRVNDGLWVRVVDVPVALEGRRYAAEGRIVIDVSDPFCAWNEGRFELVGGPGGARCRPTDTEPDLVCSANDLGAVYLGGPTFRHLHRAGRVVEERAGALARADAMFESDPAPWCSFQF
jgi:predicted acetyltransferase